MTHAVRDMLPDLVAGRLDDMRVRRVEAHVEACADCAAELEVLRALTDARQTVPEGLEARIRSAIHEELDPGPDHAPEPVPEIRLPRRWSRFWSPWTAAIAATIVALVGGTLVLTDHGTNTLTEEEVLALETSAPYGNFPGANGEVAGVATLDDLSDEELEQLLAEMEL